MSTVNTEREISTMQVRSIGKRIKQVQKALKLASYRVNYQVKDGMSAGDYAEITCLRSKKKAQINFNARRIDEELNDTITHELLHLFFYSHFGIAEESFKRQKKKTTLNKYLKGEEDAIKILASLLSRSILK